MFVNTLTKGRLDNSHSESESETY